MNNKIAIVTGAAGGIGSAITKELLNNEIFCVCVDINKKALAGLQKHYGDKVVTLYCDITNPESVKGMVQSVVKKCGGFDILINNAGIIEPNLFEHVSYNEIVRQVQVNLMGPINCTYEALPHLKKKQTCFHSNYRLISRNSTGNLQFNLYCNKVCFARFVPYTAY